MKRIISIVSILLLFASCHSRSSGTAGTSSRQLRSFPSVEIPSIYSDPEDRADYVLDHFWDGFFAAATDPLTAVTDAEAILGVANGDVEQALSNFISIFDSVPMGRAQRAVRHLFDQISAVQLADTSSHVYRLMTEMVASYLYDPNSPMRNEDYFLPFVKALSESPLTSEDMRPGYEYQARMCAINQFGQQVPDFSFKDRNGRIHKLYGIKAAYTMLFFSNPGCNACKAIVDEVSSHPLVPQMLMDGRLAVVNIYIDEDIAAWREYEHNYPSEWISGYDHNYTIRSSQNYDIRAIPSLYLLDAEKKVIMKDAPTDRVLRYFEQHQNRL